MHACQCVTVTSIFATALLAASNPFVGQWKLNPAKSTFAPGQELKDMTVSFTAEGDKIRRVASGSYANGKPLDEGGPEGNTFAWDGKEHTLHDVSPNVIVAVTPVKNRATHVTIKMDGKLFSQVRAQVSPDGQTLTETSDNTDQQGRHSKSVLAFERQ